MDIDANIRLLFEKLEARKAVVAELKTKIDTKWKTNCAYKPFGQTATINLQTSTTDTIEAIAIELSMTDAAKANASAKLNRKLSPKINGFTADEWFADLAKRLATIDVREEEKQVEVLEQRLNSVLSPELRRAMEVELLMKEI